MIGSKSYQMLQKTMASSIITADPSSIMFDLPCSATLHLICKARRFQSETLAPAVEPSQPLTRPKAPPPPPPAAMPEALHEQLCRCGYILPCGACGQGWQNGFSNPAASAPQAADLQTGPNLEQFMQQYPEAVQERSDTADTPEPCPDHPLCKLDWVWFKSKLRHWSTVIYEDIIEEGVLVPAFTDVAPPRNLNWLQELPTGPDFVLQCNEPAQRELAKQLLEALHTGCKEYEKEAKQSSSEAVGKREAKQSSSAAVQSSSEAVVHPHWVQPTLFWLEHITRSEIPYPAYLLHAAVLGKRLRQHPDGTAFPVDRDNQTWSEAEHVHIFLARVLAHFLSTLVACEPTQAQLKEALLVVGWLVPKPAQGLRRGRDFKAENLDKLAGFWPLLRVHEPALSGTWTAFAPVVDSLGH